MMQYLNMNTHTTPWAFRSRFDRMSTASNVRNLISSSSVSMTSSAYDTYFIKYKHGLLRQDQMHTITNIPGTDGKSGNIHSTFLFPNMETANSVLADSWKSRVSPDLQYLLLKNCLRFTNFFVVAENVNSYLFPF